MSPRRSAAAPAAPAPRPVIPDDDPLLQAFLNAPLDDGPIPEEEARAMEEAEEALRSGGSWVDGDAVSAEIAARAARGE